MGIRRGSLTVTYCFWCFPSRLSLPTRQNRLARSASPRQTTDWA